MKMGVNLGARVDQMYAIAAGITVGTAPMIWSNVIAFGPLDLRVAHLSGAITLMLVLLPRSSAVVKSSAVVGLGAIGTLTILGATLNAFTFENAFWPTSEIFRFTANLLIALAVVTALRSVDSVGARRMAWSIGGGLSWSLTVWLRSIEATDPGIVGAARATLTGRTHHLLYDIQLPALRTLYDDSIELGVRHSTIFSFLIAAAVMLLLSDQHPDDLRLRRASYTIACAVVIVTFLSSSRSGIAAIGLAGLAIVISRRHDLARRARTYVVLALAVGAGGTAVARSIQDRFTSDTDSFRNRQLNVSALLDGDWSVAGLESLPADLESPHNSLVEMAAGGGVLALLAAGLMISIVVAGLLPRRSASYPVLMLSSAVALRIATAARGSLDTAALIALAIVIVSLSSQSARASTSSRSADIASEASMRRPMVPLSVSAWRRYP